MFRLSNTPTVPVGDDEIANDADEPPDQISELKPALQKDNTYSKSTLPSPYTRRESLLTKAINGGNKPADLTLVNPNVHDVPRALSTASSHSIPSTAELTSDCDMTSPARSISPSPPPSLARISSALPIKSVASSDQVVIAPTSKDDKPHVVDIGEAAVEKTLGRKRCIMFACSEKSSENIPKALPPTSHPAAGPQPEPQPRKCRLTFVCPSRQESTDSMLRPSQAHEEQKPSRPLTPQTNVATSCGPETQTAQAIKVPVIEQPLPTRSTPPQAFHEFGSSQDETDSWVDKPAVSGRPKLTLDDVMRKENAIRQIGVEAEEEAEEEQREQEELEDDLAEENDGEDDFAPSDDENDQDGDISDAGNESDDEGGFADSDDESDAASEYQFWAPSTNTAATSMDNLTHFSMRQRSRSSSIDSTPSQNMSARPTKIFQPRHVSSPRPIKMRPGTPELPDSTDFVCGTLDEDRPLEAAFIACREQRKREKHVLIPQDIDPSFPTTEPEDEDGDNAEGVDEESEPAWTRNHFGVMDGETRGRRLPSATKVSPSQEKPQTRPPTALSRRNTNKSPAPQRLRSPPPRRLFGQSPTRPLRPRSPAASGRYRSPRASPANIKMPLGITINRLAQRPNNDRTASLPQTPNPFFRNWKRGSPATSRIPSAAVTPGTDEYTRSDIHVRGPVDIVIGLEKKRQKRKEKFWRQHCRKAAKEQSERKPVPGLGVERMKELGLECAERTRGYGLGQQAKLVLSL